VDPTIEPHVVDVDGTTDLVRWVPLDEVGSETAPVLPMVTHAIEHLDQFVAGS
jgi:8-oxo-dGTP diphosphatase